MPQPSSDSLGLPAPPRAGRGRALGGKGMSRAHNSIASSDHVRDAQVADGSRRAQERLGHRIDQPEMIARADIPVKVNGVPRATGRVLLGHRRRNRWPYVQFRGPPEFVRTPDDRTVARADFRGNRQYITVGNMGHDDRVALIFLDYAQRGGRTVRPVSARPPSRGRTRHPRRVTAYDWNCDQHITPRYSVAELSEGLAPLRRRLTQVKLENAELRAET